MPKQDFKNDKLLHGIPAFFAIVRNFICSVTTGIVIHPGSE